jgi:prepilin-type N-terminal cleavage/methylation domain
MPTFIPASFDRPLGERGFTLLRRSAQQGFTLLRRSAQQGFTLWRRSAEHGFTLIELMVVLTIIGFISAAVVSARPMGVWVSASGYGFQRRDGGIWVPIEDKPFVTANWKGGTRALVGKDGRQQIGFDGTGLPTDPMTVTLAREGERVSVTVDMAGKVMVGG